MKDVVLLVLGAVAGVVAQVVYSSMRARGAKFWISKRKRSALKGDDSVTHSDNLLHIYHQRGLADELFHTQTLGSPLELPILFCTDPPPAGDKPLLRLHSTEVDQLPVDQRLIDKQLAQGVKLWDGTSLYVRQLGRPGTSSPRLEVGICNYYAYVTLAQQLKREIARPDGKTPILDAMPDFTTAVTGTVGPVTMAATATCVFEAGEGTRRVAVVRRSSEVVNARGMLSVAPVFGMESNATRDRQSRYDLLTYNFLKEFLEEMFNLEDAIKAADRPRAHPDWIFHLPEAEGLIAQTDNGGMALTCTGMGIDLSDGSLTLALLAHFTEPAYLDHVQKAAIGSWESERATRDRPAVEFPDLDDSRLAEVATLATMEPSSIFSLDLARQYLGARPSIGRTSGVT